MVFTLVQAHGTAMILSYMTFASTGILFARYGRSIRIGSQRQLLGKAIWFQIHRCFLSLTALLTLLGFFFILVLAGGQWVDPQKSDIRYFIHSILGGIIVCCVIVQIWLALYRCHPNSRFRFVFDWSHRITGFLAFALSFPTIFIMVMLLSRFRPKLVPIFSCWTGWMVIIVIIFERVEYQQRTAVLPSSEDNSQTNPRPDTEAGTNTNVSTRRYNLIKLLLLFIHIIVSIILSVSFLVYLCM